LPRWITRREEQVVLEHIKVDTSVGQLQNKEGGVHALGKDPGWTLEFQIKM
jgi:hypothetical protein